MPDTAGVPAVPRRCGLLPHGRRGVATAIVALSLTALLGMIGLGTEAALWYADWVQVQGTADAAALSGAVSASVAAERTNGGPAATITYVAAQNGDVSGSGGITVTPHYPPADGTYANNPDAAEVTISMTEPLRFAALFMSTGPTISARAVALYKVTSPACVLALGDVSGGGKITMSGNAGLNAAGCSVSANSSAAAAVSVSGNAEITAYTVETEGGVSCTGNCALHLTKAYSADSIATADPLSSVQGMALPPATDFPTTCSAGAQGTCESGISVSGNNTSAIAGGTYTLTTGGINLSANASLSISAVSAGSTFYINGGVTVAGNATLDLSPGTYFLNNGALSVSGNGVVSCSGCTGGAGVTFVLTGTGTFSLSGNGSVALTAPSSNNYNSLLNGIAIYQPLADTGADSMSGNAQLVQGAIYTPGATLSISGNAGTSATTCSVYVANSISWSGNGYASDQDCAADGYAWGNSQATVSLVQ